MRICFGILLNLYQLQFKLLVYLLKNKFFNSNTDLSTNERSNSIAQKFEVIYFNTFFNLSFKNI